MIRIQRRKGVQTKVLIHMSAIHSRLHSGGGGLTMRIEASALHKTKRSLQLRRHVMAERKPTAVDQPAAGAAETWGKEFITVWELIYYRFKIISFRSEVEFIFGIYWLCLLGPWWRTRPGSGPSPMIRIDFFFFCF